MHGSKWSGASCLFRTLASLQRSSSLLLPRVCSGGSCGTGNRYVSTATKRRWSVSSTASQLRNPCCATSSGACSTSALPIISPSRHLMSQEQITLQQMHSPVTTFSHFSYRNRKRSPVRRRFPCRGKQASARPNRSGDLGIGSPGSPVLSTGPSTIHIKVLQVGIYSVL